MKLRIIAPLVLTGAFLCANCVKQPSSNDVEIPPSYSSAVASASTVPFCELVRNPTGHDKRIVRTQAEFFRELESAYLHDPACGGDSANVWVELDPSYVYTPQELKKKFDHIYCSKQPCPAGRARVTVVGRFDGPGGGPYGHLDGYRSRFSIMRLEQVEPAVSTSANR